MLETYGKYHIFTFLYPTMLDIHVSIHPSVVCLPVCLTVCILFLDDYLNKHQWIFNKFGMCIDIVEIWFGIANVPIL